jgi:predicted deacetylase
MVWKYTMEMTLSQFFNFLFVILIVLIIISILIYFFFKSKRDLKFIRRVTKYLERHQRRLVVFFLVLMIVFILAFVILGFVIYGLDKSTTVSVNEKIVIIELDDWWNFKDTRDYHTKYGYTFERFRSVTDLINKYNFTATMGVTPHIFLEEIRQNIPLKDDLEMISYIKELEDRGYEIGMHGYNHCRHEYYCPQYEEVWYNIDTGKRELESIFDVALISYFPPGNRWTTEQYENVKRAGFKVIGNTHVPKAYFDDDVIITQKGFDPIYIYKWYDLDFRHASYDEWIDEYEEINLFILQLHQNTFDSQEKLDDLDKFLAHVKQDSARVMTYREFYSYIMEKRKSEGKSLTGRAILEVNQDEA